MFNLVAIAFLAWTVLWPLAGEVRLMLTVWPSEASLLFHLEEDGCYRLRPEELPSGLRHPFWMETIDEMRQRGLAMDDIEGDGWILTSGGIRMRKLNEA